MFVVPLPGDKIETDAGAMFSAVAYTNYQDGPAVYVESSEPEANSLPFEQITKLNGAPVKLLSGKVFESAAKSRAKIQLPQKNDKLKFSERTMKVQLLKLNEHGKLASGMLVVGLDFNTNEKVTDRLSNLVGIERANGDETFDLKAFRTLYKDYLGAPE